MDSSGLTDRACAIEDENMHVLQQSCGFWSPVISQSPISQRWAESRRECGFSRQHQGSETAQVELQIFWWNSIFIDLDDSKIYRKPSIWWSKTMVSCRFSLKPIHWYCVTWKKQQWTIPKITINRWCKQFPNGWFIVVSTTLLVLCCRVLFCHWVPSWSLPSCRWFVVMSPLLAIAMHTRLASLACKAMPLGWNGRAVVCNAKWAMDFYHFRPCYLMSRYWY